MLITLQFCIPGSGFVALKQLNPAIANQGLLIGWAVLFCWSRLILEPSGIKLYLFIVALTHLSLTGWFVWEIYHQPTANIDLSRRLPKLLIFLCATLLILISGFFNKQHWLGIHLYFVPSTSMEPTLQPGDFILADTWRYQRVSPSAGDVVVFTGPQHDEVSVKRVQLWPDGSLLNDGAYYVLGDNRIHSADSRWFGGIKPDRMLGKAAIVVASIDSQFRIKPDRLLKEIR